jgi:glycosyltransferase involved in cell wall biosynthesis
VAPWYAQADVVIAPLRSGSGTRIKILEAFAHRRPVVTTTKGLEGIAAHDGTHVRVADSAEQLAAALIELEPGDRSASLIEAAWGLVSRTYNADRVRESTAQLFARITGHGSAHA